MTQKLDGTGELVLGISRPELQRKIVVREYMTQKLDGTGELVFGISRPELQRKIEVRRVYDPETGRHR